MIGVWGRVSATTDMSIYNLPLLLFKQSSVRIKASHVWPAQHSALLSLSDGVNECAIYVTFDKCAALQQTYFRRRVATALGLCVCAGSGQKVLFLLVDWEESDKISVYKFVPGQELNPSVCGFLFAPWERYNTKRRRAFLAARVNRMHNLSTLFDNCFTFTSRGRFRAKTNGLETIPFSFLSTSGGA